MNLTLDRIPFPGSPKLLLSATYLRSLQLWRIPPSAYISPETMATRLSALTGPKSFILRLELPQTHSDQESRHPPPPTCTVLPSLTYLHLALPNQPIFDTPHLFQFIARVPKFQSPNEAQITFDCYSVDITRPSLTRERHREGLRLSILCESLVDQLSCLPRVCSRSLPAIVAVEHLYICMRFPFPRHRRRNYTEVNQWLAILRLFTSVKSLYPFAKLTPRIAAALVRKTVGVTGALPALQNMFLQGYPPSGPVRDAIGQFVSARRLSSHRIAISRWDMGDDSDRFEVL